MERYRIIKSVFGGSDVYDENGNRIAYSLPSILGDGEDFYDEQGNPLGQSFDSIFGGEGYSGVNGSYGYLDQEILGGQNLWLHGELKDRQDTPDPLDFGIGPDYGADDGGNDGFDY